MAKFYIAFSIAGTNKFTVATKITNHKIRSGESLDDFVTRVFGGRFSYEASRRPNYNVQTDGIKITTSLLQNKKTGKPYVSPLAVRKAFLKLEDLGFKVVKREGVAVEVQKTTEAVKVPKVHKDNLVAKSFIRRPSLPKAPALKI